jgi:hypothetical protein
MHDGLKYLDVGTMHAIEIAHTDYSSTVVFGNVFEFAEDLHGIKS